MKHEYHLTISRTDRIWLIVFVTALLVWELIKPLIPTPAIDHMSMESAILADSNQQTNLPVNGNDPFYKKSWGEWNKEKQESSYLSPNEKLKTPIDLMQATWKEMRAVGFSAQVASNIERYIAAGGGIKNESELMKIYGMDSMEWEAVSPYILFPKPSADDAAHAQKRKEKISSAHHIPDLNTATAAELEGLPGIGPTLALRIIKYRNSLGGFIAAEQIRECYGLPPETLEKILPMIDITPSVEPIEINKRDLKNLSHPYLNKKIAGIMDAYRAQHGPFNGPDDLKKIYPADTTWYEKLLPYLTFE